MSDPTSSTINLFDSLTSSKQFQVKAGSDRVELRAADGSDLSLNLKATQIGFTNKGGESVPDAVQRILDNEQLVQTEGNERRLELSKETSDNNTERKRFNAAIEKENTDMHEAVDVYSKEREDQETVLQNLISADTQARLSGLAAESLARIQGDTTIQSLIEGEADARKSQETVLHSKLDDALLSMRAEAKKQEADAIVAETSIESRLLTATNERTAEDAVILGEISTAKTVRLTGLALETTLQADEDDSLSNYFTNKVQLLETAITIEKDRIDGVLSQSTVNADTIGELVTAYTLKDTTLQSHITSLSATQSTIQGNISKSDAVLKTLVDKDISP